MNQRKYLDVLNNHALPSGDKLIGESFILQQDNRKPLVIYKTKKGVQTYLEVAKKRFWKFKPYGRIF